MTADLVADRQIRLGDGRRLGFRVYGNAAGMPVLFLHGTPGSRLQMSLAHDVCREFGVALIAPDRWGYGLSEAPEQPILRAFADDMADLMTHLGHARFALGGISGGGPYAAAVAACLPSRVSAVALVSPVGPIADAALGPRLSRGHRFNFTFLPRHPSFVSTAFRIFRSCLKRNPRLAARLITLRAARVDRQLMRQAEIAGPLLDSFLEGLLRSTAGPGIDLAIFSRPWGVDLGCIRAPARMWIGSADRDVPLAAAHALAERIQRLVLTELQEAGHLWVVTHHSEVIKWLLSVTAARVNVASEYP